MVKRLLAFHGSEDPEPLQQSLAAHAALENIPRPFRPFYATPLLKGSWDLVSKVISML